MSISFHTIANDIYGFACPPVRGSNGKLWVGYCCLPIPTTMEYYAAYSVNNGATWTEELIDSVPVVLGVLYHPSTSIALDSAGTLHATYWGRKIGAIDRIHYRNYSGGQWSAVETVSDWDQFQLQCIYSCVDNDNNLHIVWVGRNAAGDAKILYRQRTASGTWLNAEDIDSVNLAISDSPNYICTDGSNNIYILYTIRVAGTYTMYYKKRTTTWGSAIEVSDPTVEDNAFGGISIAPDDTIHFGYTSIGRGVFWAKRQIVYRQQSPSGVFSTPELITDIDADQTFWNLALNKNGSIITFAWTGAGYSPDVTRISFLYCERKGGSWLSTQITSLTEDGAGYLDASVIDGYYPGSMRSLRGFGALVYDQPPSGDQPLLWCNNPWVIALGNINIDQLIYQHAERMR